MKKIAASLSTNSLFNVLTLLTLLTLIPTRSQANVYATNIRFNGGLTNIVIPAGTNVAITYSLNENATLGVTININAGATTVRTITLTSPGPGTLQGSNYVVWDGRNNSSSLVGGLFSVSITAASSGYTNWTQTSPETNDFEYHVWEPRGIAVNRNTNSPYYGRVFVANANQGLDPVGHLGDQVGILVLNADGTYAAEGGFSTGNYIWWHTQPPTADDFSPWKLEVGPDDRLYANDFLDQGLVLSFDQLVTSNAYRAVLRTDNYWTNSLVNYDGPFISGSAGNMQIWMADSKVVPDSSSTAGIRRWNLTAGGIIASNDVGVTIVQPGTTGGLDQVPQDMALDSSNNIYAIQDIEDQGDPAWRVLRFPAYTNVAETNAEWRIGSGDDSMAGASGIAVDPTSTYIAVAFKGYFDFPSYANGSVRVFYATNGASVMTTTNVGHDHYDVAWDNVGNLYEVDNAVSRWRTFSPPGTNQATTVSVPTIQISVPTVPVLSKPFYSSGQFQFTLTGEANATYVILSSTDLANWSPVATNTSTLAVRQITNNVSGSRTFFRALGQ
jgi:hypothetical protein